MLIMLRILRFLLKILQISPFLYLNLSLAESISDFQIEGISIGDSILDHYNINEIENANFAGVYSDDYFLSKSFTAKTQDFDYLSISYKKNDNKYRIHSITGNNQFIDDLESCFVFMDELENIVNQMFINNNKIEYEYVYKNLGDGKSIAYIKEFPLEDGQIRVYCQNWSEVTKKEFLWEIEGTIEISTKERLQWLTDANK